VSISLWIRSFAEYDVTVIGGVDMADGIGRLSVELANALRKDFSVNLIPITLKTRDVPIEILEMIKQQSRTLGRVIIFENALPLKSTPLIAFLHKKIDKIRIAYSMIESTAIPEGWVYQINHAFDAVVVPDPFLVDVYRNSGVNIPIFVIPLGLDLESFLSESLKEKSHEPFVFANFSSYEARKNHIAVIKGFYKAFGNDPSVKLWINGRRSNENIFRNLEEEVERLGINNVFVTNTCFDRKDYLNNFKKIDCYVSLSKGEGFSIQPREAMALGIPVIVSDNTAQTTICRSQLATSIQTSKEVEGYYSIFSKKFGLQYEVEEADVVKAFRDMKEHYESELAQADARRKWAAQYNYDKLYPLYKTLIKPKEIFLGKQDKITEDYMVTTSLELYKKYKKIMTSN
jgi:glycosyltransferase involved in cell wall biosynthesis